MSRSIDRLGIANRGEVAVRIIHACEELGITSVLLHSEADRKTLAYRLSNEQVCIGASPSSESYLNIENTVCAALSADVDAIHPGFGFLSENAEFAQKCIDQRLIFIGPDPESIKLFGDKISAKKLVNKIGVPTIPGYQGADQRMETLLKHCEKIGYPVIIKASAGGGGRGLRVAWETAHATEAIEAAQREGLSSFGSDQVFLEKYLDHAKHIEIQVFGESSGKIFHLYDRECTIQRRHQKVIEESVSARLSAALRNKMTQAAVKIAEEAKYKGAGTVEFLVEDDKFYFLEMNTRLQVEHPVTELVMGVDLVKAQILVAEGRSCFWEQSDLRPRGHAIEARIYAEDPYQMGLPSLGVIEDCFWPIGPGRRFDLGFEVGDEVSEFYDSMIAKVIVWDENRSRAIDKMCRTLEETVIFGIKTNIPYLLEIIRHHEFIDARMTTQFIERNFKEGLKEEALTQSEKKIREYIFKHVKTQSVGRSSLSAAPEVRSPWY